MMYNSESSQENAIVVRDLSKQFDIAGESSLVLNNISFTIPKKSFTIVYGPSGSGKSTLLNILNGLEEPSSGYVEVYNKEMYKMNADERAHFRAQSLGMVYQTNYWIKSLNVLENIAIPLFLTGHKRQTALNMASYALEQVGMSQFAKYMPTVLSGGQQQRISMARTLVFNPEIIFADEPTGNLDSKNGQAIIDLLRQINRDFKRTIILVTHNLEYLPISTQQLFIRDGKLKESHSSSKLSSIPPSQG